MAILQRRIVEYVSPPKAEIRPAVVPSRVVLAPPTPEMQELRNKIKITSLPYSCFIVATLATILVGCVIIIVVGVSIPTNITLLQIQLGNGRNNWKPTV
jgi:hypothetical protein